MFSKWTLQWRMFTAAGIILAMGEHIHANMFLSRQCTSSTAYSLQIHLPESMVFFGWPDFQSLLTLDTWTVVYLRLPVVYLDEPTLSACCDWLHVVSSPRATFADSKDLRSDEATPRSPSPYGRHGYSALFVLYTCEWNNLNLPTPTPHVCVSFVVRTFPAQALPC